jgi:hypothetical protein
MNNTYTDFLTGDEVPVYRVEQNAWFDEMGEREAYRA